MEGELGSPTGKPCIFGTTPSLVVAHVHVMSLWYSVEQGSDAEKEPRSSMEHLKLIFFFLKKFRHLTDV